MASDYFAFDNSFYSDSTSFNISDQEIMQSFKDCSNFNNIQGNSINGVEISNSLEQIAYELLSSSPPSNQFENLSIKNPQIFFNDNNNNCLDYSGQINFGSENGGLINNYFCGNSVDSGMRLMQRSYSSNLVDIKQPNYCFQTPNFDCNLDSQIRRASSTGDLQRMKSIENGKFISSGQLSGEFIEEPNFKVAKYTPEERKERIERYKAKRTQRNFNKTIKYACRKTLADNRTRVRGRFARNDEAIDIPKGEIFNRYDEDENHWGDRYKEKEVRGPFCNNYGGAGAMWQYFSY